MSLFPLPGAPRRESLAEREIRLAREAGLFDALAGAGKPLPGLDGEPDEDWWIKDKLRREQVTLELPPALAIRQAKRDLLAALPGLSDEADVRERLEALNQRIAHVNRVATVGPPSTTTLVDVEKAIAEWREVNTQ
jgi:Domain of unknown function (DUF1992)